MIVAIVDSGIDAANAHLKDAVIGGIDLVGDGTDSSGLNDLDGHGTAIAGLVAARSVPGSGVIGLAPDAQLLSVRVFRGTNEENVKAGFGPTVERLAQGIRNVVHLIRVGHGFAAFPALQRALAHVHRSGEFPARHFLRFAGFSQVQIREF